MASRVAFVGAALTMLCASGCGGTEDKGPTAEEKASAAASASAASAAAVAASQSAVAEAQFNKCTEATATLLAAAQQLNSRLSVGLSFADYGERVGDVQVAYDDSIDAILATPTECLTGVGAKLEVALNRYREVKDLWAECIDDYSCTFGEGEVNKRVQKKWAAASTAIERATSNLASMSP
ncbi:hypothetical protein [Nocardioides sp. LML1-1-1.1]|uniref:hypothetical protein n=1 Tax=Nocardioides sp. LML1-1-1.1 TaxID=3135248 RepID=UPI0034322C03